MAPTTKGRSGPSKASNKKGGKPLGSKSPGSKPSGAAGVSKSKGKPKVSRPAVQQKTKSAPQAGKKKRRVYTEKELGLPKLNMITPAGVEKPKGQKKGKVFVDDQESMMTILAMVNADKEGQIESKMMKARQMEEIRQARQREMDARQEEKKSKLEATKDSLRRKRKKNADADEEAATPSETKKFKNKKRVSFG